MQPNNSQRYVTKTVGNFMSFGILIGFLVGGIIGYVTHNFYSMLGAGFVFGLSGGIIVGMLVDRRNVRKARGAR